MRALLAVVGAIIATHLVFVLWPGLDLAVSALFYDPAAGFWINQVEPLQTLRHAIWNLALVVFAGALAGLALSLVLGKRARVDARLWGFVVALFVLGPGLLVNGLLKRFWGRARPEDVEAFGGALRFTPPVEISDACARNCSFVSGEAAASVVLALVLGVLLWHGLTRKGRWGLAALLGLIGVTGAFMRVLMGRHFLSDVVFAGLFMALLAILLGRAFSACTVRHSLTRANLAADLRSLAAMLGLGGSAAK